MADEDFEDLAPSATPARADHTQTVATLSALLWVSVVAILDAVFGGKFGLIGFLAIGPFIAAAFAGPRRTLLVGVLASFFSLVLSTPPRQYDQFNHLLRVLTEVASAGVAVWISYLRTQRNVQLWRARTETRNERRRRVAAETTQRMQAMARALTTAADPAQVADAIFAALRDELRVDAATFATTTERGVLQAHRRFGYSGRDPHDPLLAAMDPDGPIGDVLRRNVALFAGSMTQLADEWPGIASTLAPFPFNSLAIVPLVVSDRAVGVVVVQWLAEREISAADQNFLFAITGAAAQAVERARLTLMEFDSLQRSQHLHDLSSALAAATTPIDVARAAIAAGRRSLSAQSAVCRVPAPGERALSCLASSGHPALLSRGDVPVDGSLSGSCFARGRTTITTLGVDEPPGDEVADEVVARAMAELDEPVTIVTEPLIGSVGPLGVLSLAFVAQVVPSETELRFLSTLAGLTAQALERAQVFEHERQALRDAESGRERLTLLSEVTKLLSSSLDPTTVMLRTMRLVEGRLADACVVQVPGDTGLERLDVRVSDLTHAAIDSGQPAEESIPFDCDAPAAIAYRTGRAQLAPTGGFMVGGPFGDDSSALAVPLTANGEVIGVMTFIDGPGRHFEPDDVSLATEVASRTGVALSNATRFQREHVVAEVLQRAVLPDSLPQVEGLHLDAEYRAGVAGTYVGGDWYDVFELDGDHVVFSVGDVMGKGAPAASLMGQARTAIRAYAVAGQSPTEVLASLDHLFDTLVEDRIVTAVVGTINPHTGATTLANAGHPPPMILRADGSHEYTSTTGSLLIAAGLGDFTRPLHRFTLGQGDSLIMYSDGLVERRGELLSAGMARLARVATLIARDGWPTRAAAALASRLSDDEQTDDVVVLTLHVAGERADDTNGLALGTATDGMWTLQLDPVVQSTPMARHWVSAHLREVSNEAAECAALLTSELVTNAVLHAATPLSVTLHLLADRIRVDVADGSPVIPSLKDYGTDAATGRGLTLFTTLASDWGVQPAGNGKIVWFELPVDFPVPPSGLSDGSFRFDLMGIADTDIHPKEAEDAVIPVQLLGIPVTLLQKASEEYEGLFRELRLMKEHAAAGAPGAPTLPERLSVLLSEIGTRFHGLGPGLDETWQDLVDRQITSYDWSLELPQSAVVACEFYDAMLDEADEFGLSARLLTLPATSASVAVRRWFLSELVGQLHGRAPIPWSESRYRDQVSTPA